MGCDIHTYKEKRIDGQWVSGETWEVSEDQYSGDSIRYDRTGDTPYRGRNYAQFGLMAGVRWDSPHTPEVRGIPQDASPEVKREIEQWDSDGHTHSYLTVRELKELAAKVLVASSDENHAYAVHGLHSLISSVDEADISPDDIRVVFFFDN